jgi:hypothetical protein
MANTCDNRIAITDFDPKDGEAIVKCFENYPEGVGKPRPAALGSDYGSKWLTVYDSYETDDFIEVTCGSAWRPPDEWARLLSKKFQCTVRIKYDEEGTGFMGLYVAEKGRVEKDVCLEY